MYLAAFRGLGALPMDQYIQLQTQRQILASQLAAIGDPYQRCVNVPSAEGEYQQCVWGYQMQINQLQAQIAGIDAQLAQGVAAPPAPAPSPVAPPAAAPGQAPVMVPGPIVPTPGAEQPAAGGTLLPYSPQEIEVQTFTGNAPLLPGVGGGGADGKDGGDGGGLFALLALGAAVYLGG